MSILQEKKKELIDKFKINDIDTGSAAAQVAVLTERINNLMAHLNEHKHDFQCRRGALTLVGRRRKLLVYSHKQDPKQYKTLIKELKIRGPIKNV